MIIWSGVDFTLLASWINLLWFTDASRRSETLEQGDKGLCYSLAQQTVLALVHVLGPSVLTSTEINQKGADRCCTCSVCTAAVGSQSFWMHCLYGKQDATLLFMLDLGFLISKDYENRLGRTAAVASSWLFSKIHGRMRTPERTVSQCANNVMKSGPSASITIPKGATWLSPHSCRTSFFLAIHPFYSFSIITQRILTRFM